MHNKKIIAKGLALGIIASNIPIVPIANAIEEYKITKEEMKLDSSRNRDSVKENKIKNPVKVNENINVGTVLEITIGDGEYVPDLTGNPGGYETVRVTTTGAKKLVKADYDKLRTSGISKVDLSSAYSDSIPAGAFSNSTNMTDFKFPQGVKKIDSTDTYESGAFYGCSGLTGNLIIPNSVTSIGNYAFYGCNGFTGSLIIPDSVTSIGNSAFYACSGFDGGLTIPDLVTSIGDYAFSKCSGLTGNLTIPNSVTSIGNYAFDGCRGFTGSLTIPNSVTSIGESAFYGCRGFTGSLTIPNSVTSIENSAFYGCSGLTGNLTIPNSVTSIGNYAFDSCSGFTGNLTIPDSVTSIGEFAFYGCSGFDGSLTIPNSVTSIGHYAFYDCSGFTGNLTIPDSVTSIGNNPFLGLSSVDKILIKINSSDLSTNYKKLIIDKLPNTSKTVIDAPYDFDTTGTWLETTPKTIGKPVIKNIVNGVEGDLIDNKGEAVSLYIPSLYQESNIEVLKDSQKSMLPAKDSNEKHVFTKLGIYQVTVTTDLGNTSIITFEVEDEQLRNAKEAVSKAETSKDSIDINYARDLVNKLPECTRKDQLQDRLDAIFPAIELEKKTASANLDIYIKSENMLLLSLDTNSITFDDFSGVEDMEKLNAINLTVNSSLSYKINAYMPTEIQNSDKSKIMDKDILNIRANGQNDYNIFEDTTTPIVLFDNQQAGNDKNHGIDVMLKGNIAHEKDIYKTVIKFEVEQK